MDNSDKGRTGLKKYTYPFLLISLTGLYVTYVPYLLDYYVVRPQYSFWEFYHINILDGTYVFEKIILGLVLVGLYCITVNAGVSTLVLSAALFVLTHGSYVKYVNRRELLRLDDLRLTEAAGMAAGYLHFEYSPFLLVLVGGLIIFVGAGFGAELLRRRSYPRAEQVSAEIKRPCPRWVMPAARALGVLTVCGILVGYMQHYFAFKMQWDEIDVANPVETDSNRYVLYQFLRNDSLIFVDTEDVVGSRAHLTKQGAMLVNSSEPAADSVIYPSVIVIMNESWWNTDWLDDDRITFSRDPMEPYRQLENQCGSGYLTSNIYGGGTVSSEAEFLTGLNTKYYVASSGIYAMTMDRTLPSVVDYFDALDYETTAIHPYYGNFYGRSQVYHNMAFDNIIFEEDMRYRELYTRYISDDSLASEIIAQYESSESERQFIWAVSIANHGLNLEYSGGTVENYEYPISVTLREKPESEEDNLKLTNYVNGIYLANQAYARLVEYFSQREEPVVLVMYGDHIPNFSEGIYEALGFDTAESEDAARRKTTTESAVTSAGEGKAVAEDALELPSTETFSLEQQRKIYSVPVLLWSNLSAEKPSFTGESIHYLPQIVLDHAGLPDSDMTLALRYERSLFKTNSRTFVMDAEGEPVRQCTEEQIQGLRMMQILEYDIMFGEELCRDIWYPLKKDK